MARPVGSKNKIEGAAAWRNGPTAARMRELSLATLEDAVSGYVSYRLPTKNADGSITYGEWTYEKVDVQHRISAAKELLDRTDGKAPQAIVGDKDNPVSVDASAGLLELFRRMAETK